MKIQTRIEAIGGLAALIGGLSFGHPTRVAFWNFAKWDSAAADCSRVFSLPGRSR